jgi:hypothetical protein
VLARAVRYASLASQAWASSIGPAAALFGNPLEMVGPEKQRRLRPAAAAWSAAHPESGRHRHVLRRVQLADRVV